MALMIDGKGLAARIEGEAKAQLEEVRAHGAEPQLVAIQVGEDPASRIYLRHQERACARLGIPYRVVTLDEEVSEKELLRQLNLLNRNPEVTGIILQVPLPEGLSQRKLRQAIHPDKDVEGIHPQSLGSLLSGQPGFVPCTAAAAFACLKEGGASIEGQRAVVVGHSETVGKPVALLLMEALATVTVCHHATVDLARHTRDAELLVVAVGRPGLITPDHVAEGAIVVDVGINEVEEDGRTQVVGDVATESVAEKAAAITPVPGGVGPVTVAMLLENTVRAAARGPMAL